MQEKRQEQLNKISSYFDDCCLDIQGISTSQSIANASEAQLARILTKIVVGAASIWWSLLEFKDFLKNRRTEKGF